MNHNSVQYEGLYPVPPRNPVGLEVNNEGLEVPTPYTPYSHWRQPSPEPTYSQEYAYNEGKTAPQTRQQRRICGLVPITFSLLIIILGLLLAVIGAAIGGTLGAKSHNHTPVGPANTTTVSVTSTVTATTTVTAAAPTSTADFLDSCTNGTTYTSSTGSTFMELCETDLGTGTLWHTNTSDIGYVAIHSFHACMDLCAFSIDLGLTWRNTAGSCKGVAWVSDGSGQNDCWLKNGTGTAHSSLQVQSGVLLIA